MRYRVTLDPVAMQDIKTAMRWYEDRREGLGKDFRLRAMRAIDSLKHHPMHPIRYQDVRMLHLSPFPYSLHYSVNEEARKVHIWGVIAAARDPEHHWVWHG